jgi:AcrR family transcriptional regulator
MPRPTRHEPDALLDAAAAILAAEGPAAVTMSAVSRATGAPSGSLYHRFPTRAVLCGELWTRTEERFHVGLHTALAASADPQDRCVAAARYVVAWCRSHPVDAQVLLAGADTLEASDWPDEISARRKTLHRRLYRVLQDLSADPERVNAAVIDIPYAIVRRHLRGGTAIPPGTEDIVADCAKALIPPG